MDEGLQKFWKDEVYPIINNLLGGRYHIPEIQTMFSANFDEIVKIWGKWSVKISPIIGGLRGTEIKYATPFSCCREDLKKRWLFFLRRKVKGHVIFINMEGISFCLEQVLATHNKTHTRQECLEGQIVLGMMHELDHIALNLAGEALSLKNTEAMIAIYAKKEWLTWARTCENTIRLLVENNMVVSREDMDTYAFWVSCGRNSKNRVWQNFIRQRYRQNHVDNFKRNQPKG